MAKWIDRAYTVFQGVLGVRSLRPLVERIISSQRVPENMKLALRNYLGLDFFESAVRRRYPRPLSFPELLRKALLAKRASETRGVNVRYAMLGVVTAASLYEVPVPAFVATAGAVLLDILQDCVSFAAERSKTRGAAFKELDIPVEYASILDDELEREFLEMLAEMLKKDTLPEEILNVKYAELRDASAFYTAYKRQIKLAIERFVCSRYHVQLSIGESCA